MSNAARTEIERHRTAMHRISLSRPMALACDDGLVTDSVSVFDYGCGRGGDVDRLRAAGVEVSGWDPAFAPDWVRRPADVVNLGYVVNVIERPAERRGALLDAWGLARRLLVVAARLEWESRDLRGRVHGDGVVTSKGTFQKLYTQEELRSWIESTLGVQAVAAAPGIYYVFKDGGLAQTYLASRVRRRAAAPRPLVSERLYEENRELFDELAEFVAARGRVPRPSEFPSAAAVTERLGSIQRAFAILRRLTGVEQWEEIAQNRARDLLVYLALAKFGRRPSFGALPQDLQFDVREFFGSYKDATAQADRLLFGAGNSEEVDLSARASVVGKLTNEALYVHATEVPNLPPLLRVYEGCARALTGTVADANIIKLHRQKAQVSYLSYPSFDKKAHPELHTVIIARLARLDVTFRDFRESANPPVLHRKETFVGSEYPGRERFARLTSREEAAGLFEDHLTIGTRDGWAAALAARNLEVRGHRLQKLSPHADATGTGSV